METIKTLNNNNKMKLDETTLIEIQDYINALDEKVGLKSETVEDIQNAINKHKSELKNLRDVINRRDQLILFAQFVQNH